MFPIYMRMFLYYKLKKFLKNEYFLFHDKKINLNLYINGTDKMNSVPTTG